MENIRNEELSNNMPAFDHQSRKIFIILGSHSLSYGEKCIASLLNNSLDPLDIKFITDSSEDKKIIAHAVSSIKCPLFHKLSFFDKGEADKRADVIYGRYDNLRSFRNGHPCWRKITDPFLFADSDEIIILDPDVYYPNIFVFNPTPQKQLLLMWQTGDCLRPYSVVETAFRHNLFLAENIDIGIAQLNKSSVDLAWLDWLIGKLGGKDLPKEFPHVEAIIWACLALRIGGGYLDPAEWQCWYTTMKKLFIRLKLPESFFVNLIERENLNKAKCVHYSYRSQKWFLKAYGKLVLHKKRKLVQISRIIPFKKHNVYHFLLKKYSLFRKNKTKFKMRNYSLICRI